MKLREFRFVTDENVDPDVVAYLRGAGWDIVDAVENGWQGTRDLELLRRSVALGRVVITHDRDFGTLALLQSQPIIGLLYLRPAHIESQFTIETIEAVIAADLDLVPPFVLVAKRTGMRVTIRRRTLANP